jgi:RNA polymerase sigma factor (TIGR02999 family)
MGMPQRSDSDVSGLLTAWAGGDLDARDRLVPLVYQELRRRAAVYLRRERPGQTLQPTALVHETFLRLIKQDHAAWKNRSQFLGVASRVMRRVLVDRARERKGTRRKGGQWVQVPFDEARVSRPPLDVSLLDLDSALRELAAFDARKSEVAELRFFGGLTLAEAADVLGLSVATIEREWQTARAWLYARLTKDPRRDA